MEKFFKYVYGASCSRADAFERAVNKTRAAVALEIPFTLEHVTYEQDVAGRGSKVRYYAFLVTLLDEPVSKDST